MRLLYYCVYQSPCSAFLHYYNDKAVERLDLLQCIAAYLQRALP